MHAHQPWPTQPWRQSRAEGAEGLCHQLQLQAVAQRDQACAQALFAGHHLTCFGVAVQLEHPAQHLQRSAELGIRAGRHRPALRHQFGNAALRRADADQPGALRPFAQHAQAFALGPFSFMVAAVPAMQSRRLEVDQLRVDAELELFGPAVFVLAPQYFELGLAFDQLDPLPRRILEHHRRMPDQRYCSLRDVDLQAVDAAEWRALDMAQHGVIAVAAAAAFLQLQQRHWFQLEQAFGREAAFQGLDLLDPALRVELKLPGQFGRTGGGLGGFFIGQRADGCQCIAPWLTRCAKKIRRRLTAGQIDRQRAEFEPLRCRSHPRCQPLLSGLLQTLQQGGDGLGRPAWCRLAQPGGQQQSVAGMAEVGKVGFDPG